MLCMHTSLPALTQQQCMPLFDELAQQGLVLATIVSMRQLPDTIWLDKAYRKDTGCLLLLGHGGRLFWERYKNYCTVSVLTTADPVDHFSATVSKRALQHHLSHITREAMFPLTDCPVNLMALGQFLGWHTPSPLGMGINAQYGMWSAYRALWWLGAEAETEIIRSARDEVAIPETDICSQCITQDCLLACPASALAMGAMPNLQRCADYRLLADSACQDTCRARMACPVVPEHRYTGEQMAYHYDLRRSQIQLFSSAAQQQNNSRN